ncbi:hypothetical protein NPX13_g8598 [Xylaria arbuscula]|uniref:Uncharacterized protein n=1 Tax=Xylaria arbuscula TaxID=114810 RepID=A0A9W8TJP1_9PEZI|nr:hypothetical protein NPX13_g8598 [Xylaria arbuscula]
MDDMELTNDGEAVYLGESAEGFATRQDKWFEKADMALAAIRSRLSKNAFQRQKADATPVTPALLWAWLKREYKPKGKAQFATYFRQWEECTLESSGSVTKYAAALQQIQANITDLHNDSAWPQSHIEIGIAEIPIMDDNGAVTKVAITLEEATEAAVQVESSQKDRAAQTAFFAGKVDKNGGSSANSAYKGTKRKSCGYCSIPHPPPCYIEHPELKPVNWETDQRKKRARYREQRLKELRGDATKGGKGSTLAVSSEASTSANNKTIAKKEHLLIAYSLVASCVPPTSTEPGLLSSMFRGFKNIGPSRQGTTPTDKPQQGETDQDWSISPKMERTVLEKIPKDSRLADNIEGLSSSIAALVTQYLAMQTASTISGQHHAPQPKKNRGRQLYNQPRGVTIPTRA